MSSQRERLAWTLIVLVASTVATFIGLLWVTSMAMAVPITLQGTFTEALGAANGRSYEITNMTGQSMSDLTASIQKDGGGDPGAKIKNIAITGGFQNDFEQAASP